MRTAAITGGGQGIGRAAAVAFANEGYRVSIADPDKEAGLETIRHIRKNGGQAVFLRTDVSVEQEVEHWLKVTVAEFGTIDVLINNAGITKSAPLLELDAENFDRVIAVNVRGTFLCAQRAARRMADNGGGSIVNIASTRALMSEADTEAYAASKGAIVALTHALAVSLGPCGIRVNAISPGWIETGPWLRSDRAYEPRHSDRDRSQHPVGRVGRTSR